MKQQNTEAGAQPVSMNGSKPICVCGAPASDHSTLKRAPGARSTNCICYRTSLIKPLYGEALTRELEHWAYRTGLAPDSRPWEGKECERAWKHAQYQGRRTILVRKLKELERNIRDMKIARAAEQIEYAHRIQRAHNEMASKLSQLAAIPELPCR